jgi:hypothetical protein
MKWAIVNVVAAAALMISARSNLFVEFWATEVAKNIALVATAIARTVHDYISVWSFYYPRGEESPRYDNIPAPRPGASASSRIRVRFDMAKIVLSSDPMKYR